MTFGPKVPKLTPKEERLAYELVTARDDNTCQRCLRNCGPINRDHRKLRSQGGRTVASNLQLLGGSGTTGCHGWATTHPLAAVRDGWAVPGWGDPARWPARRYVPQHGGVVAARWVLYDDEGDFRVISDERAEALMDGYGTIY